MHRLLLPLLALLAPLPAAAVAPTPAPAPAQQAGGAEKLPPPGFHLGSFSSLRSARLTSDGRIDSGAAILSIGDGETRLVPESIGYGRGPTLVGEFSGRLQGLLVEGAAVCRGDAVQGDDRSVVALQLRVTNEGRQSARLPLVLELTPGDGDPLSRPLPSLAFQPETRFGLDDDGVITRDGLTLLRWLGNDPEVDVFERVGSAGDVAARLTFPLDIPPGVGRYVEVELAGPPQGEVPDEQAWRKSFLRRTFRDMEEGLRWEWQVRGRHANFVSPVAVLGRSFISAAHMLRSFGIAHRAARALSDRPYGHPPRDAAVECEILGAFMLLNLDEISADQLDRLVDGLEQTLAGLSPERRLAYLHGLVQAMRLGRMDDRGRLVAQAVLDHVESVPVRPWFDPADVRADLAAFVAEAELEGADELPELEWAVAEPGTVAARVLAVRQAMSAGDIDVAWAEFEAFLRGGWRGMGAWEPGGELDGRFSLAVVHIIREMLLDDHGDTLQVFPRVPAEFVTRGSELHIDFLPTRYGQVRAQLYAVGRKNMGLWVRFIPGLRDAPLVGWLPHGYRPRRLLGKPTGGEAQILDDGSMQLWMDEVGSGGLRLSAGVGAIND